MVQPVTKRIARVVMGRIRQAVFFNDLFTTWFTALFSGPGHHCRRAAQPFSVNNPVPLPCPLNEQKQQQQDRQTPGRPAAQGIQARLVCSRVP